MGRNKLFWAGDCTAVNLSNSSKARDGTKCCVKFLLTYADACSMRLLDNKHWASQPACHERHAGCVASAQAMCATKWVQTHCVLHAQHGCAIAGRECETTLVAMAWSLGLWGMASRVITKMCTLVTTCMSSCMW